jgi:hypothetical protein
MKLVVVQEEPIQGNASERKVHGNTFHEKPRKKE